MLIATSTQMLSAVQNQVLRCLMGDMLNGRAPVYFFVTHIFSHLFLKTPRCIVKKKKNERTEVGAFGGWGGGGGILFDSKMPN